MFDVSQFTFPSGVYLGFVLVPRPAAPNGSTFDFASGPIIPSSVFPVLVRGDVLLNGAVFDGGAVFIRVFGLPSRRISKSHIDIKRWEELNRR